MNTSTFFESRTISKMSIATGVIGVSTLIFGLIFTFAGDIVPIFYSLNDLLNLIMALMSGVLAWLLYSRFRENMSMLHVGMLILVAVAMIFALIGFVKIAFGYTGWILSGWYTDTGYALIGLWIMGLNYSALKDKLYSKGISLYGIAVGAMMALGFSAIPGMIRNIDSTGFMSPLLYGIWNASLAGWILLYPIWCMLLGVICLSRDKPNRSIPFRW